MNAIKNIPMSKFVPFTKRGLNIIRSPHAFGQPNKGVISAPDILLKYHNLVDIIEDTKTYEDIKITNDYESCEYHYDNLTIGGDHMVAFDSIAYQLSKINNKRFGLVWIDAHADINTRDTTNTNNKHGMVISNLMKIDDSIDTNNVMFEKLLPHNIVYIGLRDVEQKEVDIINEHKIEHCSSEQIHRAGAQRFIDYALKWILHDCDHIHVSFDVDVMDPKLFPATGTPVDNGLSYRHVMDITNTLKNDLRVKSMDIVEYDPSMDHVEFPCGALCNSIITSVLTK